MSIIYIAFNFILFFLRIINLNIRFGWAKKSGSSYFKCSGFQQTLSAWRSEHLCTKNEHQVYAFHCHLLLENQLRDYKGRKQSKEFAYTKLLTLGTHEFIWWKKYFPKSHEIFFNQLYTLFFIEPVFSVDPTRRARSTLHLGLSVCLSVCLFVCLSVCLSVRSNVWNESSWWIEMAHIQSMAKLSN